MIGIGVEVEVGCFVGTFLYKSTFLPHNFEVLEIKTYNTAATASCTPSRLQLSTSTCYQIVSGSSREKREARSEKGEERREQRKKGMDTQYKVKIR